MNKNQITLRAIKNRMYRDYKKIQSLILSGTALVFGSFIVIFFLSFHLEDKKNLTTIILLVLIIVLLSIFSIFFPKRKSNKIYRKIKNIEDNLFSIKETEYICELTQRFEVDKKYVNKTTKAKCFLNDN